jgi:tetratricopeptide (TPR) repeat protein
MKAENKKHLRRLGIFLLILALASLASVLFFHFPPRLVLVIFLASSLSLLAVYTAMTFAQSRGVLPRGIPIKPFRAPSRGDYDDDRFFMGDGNTPASAGNKTVIEDYIETSRSLMQSQRYEEAAELIKKALEIDPVNSRLLNYLGICYSRMSRYEEAAKVYQTSIEQDYDNASAHFNLAVALENAERISESVDQYYRYIKIGKIVEEPDEMLTRAADRIKCLRGTMADREKR